MTLNDCSHSENCTKLCDPENECIDDPFIMDNLPANYKPTVGKLNDFLEEMKRYDDATNRNEDDYIFAGQPFEYSNTKYLENSNDNDKNSYTVRIPIPVKSILWFLFFVFASCAALLKGCRKACCKLFNPCRKKSDSDNKVDDSVDEFDDSDTKNLVQVV